MEGLEQESKMSKEEAIELYEKAKALHLDHNFKPSYQRGWKDGRDSVLELFLPLLEKQPEPTKFTESYRNVINRVDPQANSLMSKDNPPVVKILADWGRKACFELDHQAREIAYQKQERIKAIELIAEYDRKWGEDKLQLKAELDRQAGQIGRLEEELESKCDNCVHLLGAVP